MSDAKESLLAEMHDFFAGFPVHLQKFFIGLGHVAPTLTTVAVAAETLAGAPELIPMTQAAGAAVSQLAEGLESSGEGVAGALHSVQAVASAVSDVAKVGGASSVVAGADKVVNALHLAGVTV